MTKEEILDYFKDINGAYNNCNMHDDLSCMLDELLGEQPKQKTGEWVGEEYWFMCSECQFDCPHFIRDWNYEQVRTKYCPHCGAKMKNPM